MTQWKLWLTQQFEWLQDFSFTVFLSKRLLVSTSLFSLTGTRNVWFCLTSDLTLTLLYGWVPQIWRSMCVYTLKEDIFLIFFPLWSLGFDEILQLVDSVARQTASLSLCLSVLHSLTPFFVSAAVQTLAYLTALFACSALHYSLLTPATHTHTHLLELL